MCCPCAISSTGNAVPLSSVQVMSVPALVVPFLCIDIVPALACPVVFRGTVLSAHCDCHVLPWPALRFHALPCPGLPGPVLGLHSRPCHGISVCRPFLCHGQSLWVPLLGLPVHFHIFAAFVQVLLASPGLACVLALSWPCMTCPCSPCSVLACPSWGVVPMASPPGVLSVLALPCLCVYVSVHTCPVLSLHGRVRSIPLGWCSCSARWHCLDWSWHRLVHVSCHCPGMSLLLLVLHGVRITLTCPALALQVGLAPAPLRCPVMCLTGQSNQCPRLPRACHCCAFSCHFAR